MKHLKAMNVIADRRLIFYLIVNPNQQRFVPDIGGAILSVDLAPVTLQMDLMKLAMPTLELALVNTTIIELKIVACLVIATLSDRSPRNATLILGNANAKLESLAKNVTDAVKDWPK